MISYLDTSVLIPAVIDKHENHQVALNVIGKAMRQGSIVSTTLHTYAELFNTLTRPTPAKTEILPEDAYELIVNQLGPFLELIELTKEDYEAALKRCADLKLIRSVIYDALHVQAALKAGASVLYTDNLRDFNRLVTEDDTIEVKDIRD